MKIINQNPGFEPRQRKVTCMTCDLKRCVGRCHFVAPAGASKRQGAKAA